MKTCKLVDVFVVETKIYKIKDVSIIDESQLIDTSLLGIDERVKIENPDKYGFLVSKKVSNFSGNQTIKNQTIKNEIYE